MPEVFRYKNLLQVLNRILYIYSFKERKKYTHLYIKKYIQSSKFLDAIIIIVFLFIVLLVNFYFIFTLFCCFFCQKTIYRKLKSPHPFEFSSLLLHSIKFKKSYKNHCFSSFYDMIYHKKKTVTNFFRKKKNTGTSSYLYCFITKI